MDEVATTFVSSTMTLCLSPRHETGLAELSVRNFESGQLVKGLSFRYAPAWMSVTVPTPPTFFYLLLSSLERCDPNIYEPYDDHASILHPVTVPTSFHHNHDGLRTYHTRAGRVGNPLIFSYVLVVKSLLRGCPSATRLRRCL